MDLTEWNPFHSYDTASAFKMLEHASVPRIDIYQTNSDVIVKAEIPGVTKSDLNVYVTDNSIQISAERKKSDEYSDNNIYRNERYYGSFYRTIALPAEIVTDSVSASYTDGVLSVTAKKIDNIRAKQHKINVE